MQKETLTGQWQNVPPSTWHAVLNIDADRPSSARLLMFDRRMPTVWRHARLNDLIRHGNTVTGTAAFSRYPDPFTPQNQTPIELDGGPVKLTLLPQQELLVDIYASQEHLRLGFVTTETETPSEPDHRYTWQEFKQWVAAHLTHDRPLIFRGHKKARYRLRTTLHRTGRRDLIRYEQEDLPILREYVSSVNGRRYQLERRQDFNELLSLAQHHGYPTPLLDWTESPFIAAYFAFQGLQECRHETRGHCRIFAFDFEKYQGAASAQDGALWSPFLSLHVHRATFTGTDRAQPQQSVFMLSNVPDIETLITSTEEQASQTRLDFLTKIDLPLADARQGLDELRQMGITHASLFPGIDGVCLELSDRFFARRW